MYRARVEAVSELKVRAGGKWLTCIGNRVVRAGDMVWTDGRCVYGHDREAQTPIVIANPAEDLAIPIMLGTRSIKDPNGKERKDSFWYDCCTFRRKRLRYYQDFSPAPYKGCLVNSRDGKLYAVPDCFTANIDSNGNVYRVAVKTTNQYVEVSYNNFELTKTIQVLKNDHVVYETSPSLQNLGWAFIENENNWAFITNIRIPNIDIIKDYNDNAWSFSATGYFFSSSGESKRLYTTAGVGGGTIRSKEENFTGLEGLICPVQDGYTMKIDKVFPTPPYKVSIPEVAKFTLYSPNGDIVVSDHIVLGTYLTVYQLKSNKHLLGVCASELSEYARHVSDAIINNYHYILRSSPTWEVDIAEGGYPSFLRGGIYSCIDGKISQNLTPNYIFAANAWWGDGDGMLHGKYIENANDIQLRNSRLYPIKNSLNWWEHIQTLE